MYRSHDIVRAIWRDWRLGYGLGIGAFAIAFAVRMATRDVLGNGFPFITFFPAVIVTAFLAGTRPAIVCAVLSGLTAWYFFIPPIGSFTLTPESGMAMLFYVFVVGVEITLFHLMTLAGDQLQAEREVTARLYDRQRVMFQELQHRVANNMNVVASLLRLLKRQVAANPALAPGAIEDAAHRIALMSQVHRQLYDPGSSDLPIGDYFRTLCKDLLAATSDRDIRCAVDMVPVRLDIDRLMTLSLFVTEIITNSVKHGFAGRPGGEIALTLREPMAGELVLTISDNGNGLPADHDPDLRTGLGTLIVKGFATQLGGRLHVSSRRGVTTELVFPTAAAIMAPA